MGRRLAVGALLVVAGGAADRRDALAADVSATTKTIASATKATISAGTPPIPPATAMIGMQSARFAGWMTLSAPLGAALAARDPLVDPPVDLLLDPVEEARDQLLVVRRAELLARGERRLQLLLDGRFAHPDSIATAARRGKRIC